MPVRAIRQSSGVTTHAASNAQTADVAVPNTDHASQSAFDLLT